MKRRIYSLLALTLSLALTACSSDASAEHTASASETEEAAAAASSAQESVQEKTTKTVTGMIASVDGTEVTLHLGEENTQFSSDPMTQKENGREMPPDMPEENGDSQTPPDKPDGNGDSQTPPDKPEGNSDSQTPPDKPDENGDSQTPPDKPEGNSDSQTPPDKPEENGNEQAPPDMPEGETVTYDLSDAVIYQEQDSGTVTASLADLTPGAFLRLELSEEDVILSATILNDSMEPGNGGGFGGGGFGGSGQVTQGTAQNTINTDGVYEDETYTSTGDDENALRIQDATVTLNAITVDKSAGSSSNTEDGDFYGMNAALLATDGAQVTISDAVISSSAQNGNGVFSYGEGTLVRISDSVISTTKDNSGGIQTTGGGATEAENLTVTTKGNSSAAIRSDRGGGTVNVKKGSYTTNGYNSPAIYSTADISVSDADLTATNSEALVIEGQNSIALTDCTVSGSMSKDQGTSSDENVHNVMIYQSMSGDAQVGTAGFSMKGGSLTCESGDQIYVTNTHAIISLSGVSLINNDPDGNLLTVAGNSGSHGWGTAGANGAQVTFTADAQALEGNITVDTISSLDLTLTNGSSFTGAIHIVDNEEGGVTTEDHAVLTIEEGCTFTLTGDCTLSSLTCEGTILYNGYTITLADGTVLG